MCSTSADCAKYIPQYPYCISGACQQCGTNSECPPLWPFCIANYCTQCNSNSECGSGCSCSNHYCVCSGSSGAASCQQLFSTTSFTAKVSADNGECGVCSTSADCGGDPCTSGNCLPSGGSCPSQFPYNYENNWCTQCFKNSECPNGVQCACGMCDDYTTNSGYNHMLFLLIILIIPIIAIVYAVVKVIRKKKNGPKANSEEKKIKYEVKSDQVEINDEKLKAKEEN